MKRTIVVGMAVALFSSFGALALAGSAGADAAAQTPEQRNESVSDLQAAKAEIVRSRQLSLKHGIWAIADTTKEKHIDDMIDRLQKGEAVSPEEIDELKR